MTSTDLKGLSDERLREQLQFQVLRTPHYSDWQANVAGVTYRPLAINTPNAFHRLMQRLILGIKWEKVTP